MVDVDTIAAVATAPGRGAVAVVRVSGPDAAGVLAAVAPAFAESPPPPRRATLATLVDPRSGAAVDRALVTRFVAPESYTGEDVVELACHGGWTAPALVLEACLAAGARRAEPGEFTRRAYLHGKLDLVQVEAVADVVDARSRALHRASLAQLERGLSERVGALREALVRLEAHLAHHLDFPEEDDAPVPIEAVRSEADGAVGRMDRLLATAPGGALLREGAVVVLAGRPNAGKSSLYNALVGEERALVTEVPGTTRDALEAAVELDGYPFRLVDTAGLRESGDRVERLGVEVARRALRRADLVLLCVEGPPEAGWGPEGPYLDEADGVPVVRVATKADLWGGGVPGGTVERRGGGDGFRCDLAGPVRVSARTGEGLDVLRDLLPRLVYTGLVESAPGDPVLTRARHERALRGARDEVCAFRDALERGVPAEIAATHLRSAETGLEELLGTIATDDVLDEVFRRFCVGK